MLLFRYNKTSQSCNGMGALVGYLFSNCDQKQEYFKQL